MSIMTEETLIGLTPGQTPNRGSIVRGTDMTLTTPWGRSALVVAALAAVSASAAAGAPEQAVPPIEMMIGPDLASLSPCEDAVHVTSHDSARGGC